MSWFNEISLETVHAGNIGVTRIHCNAEAPCSPLSFGLSAKCAYMECNFHQIKRRMKFPLNAARHSSNKFLFAPAEEAALTGLFLDGLSSLRFSSIRQIRARNGKQKIAVSVHIFVDHRPAGYSQTEIASNSIGARELLAVSVCCRIFHRPLDMDSDAFVPRNGHGWDVVQGNDLEK
jgi:hypothetical protein